MSHLFLTSVSRFSSGAVGREAVGCKGFDGALRVGRNGFRRMVGGFTNEVEGSNIKQTHLSSIIVGATKRTREFEKESRGGTIVMMTSRDYEIIACSG